MKKLLPYALSLFCGIPILSQAQAIRASLLPMQGALRVTNDSLRRNYTNITLEWQLLVNGIPKQKGTVPGISLLPGQPRTIRLPLRPLTGGEEAFLKVGFRRPPQPGPPIATQQLKWKTWGGDIAIPAAGDLSFTDSNDVFTVSSPTLRLSFDKQTGWIQQYEVNHIPFLADTNGLRPALQEPPHFQLFSTSTGSQMVIVRTEYTLPGISCLLHLSYTVNAAGAMLVEQTLETDTTRQDSLPHTIARFGMDWVLPPGADSLAWYGIAPEDLPDTLLPTLHHRYLPATFGQNPAAPIALLVRWWTLTDRAGRGFQLTADSNLLGHITATTPPIESRLRQLYPTSTQLQIDDTAWSRVLPAAHFFHYHYAFRTTPITPAPPAHR
ncbi:MAG TPA: beta-galactosidase domain 4-containing protein [Puia sp.]|nr:beta-galactosidase domain 4-containing protein [Puia sp.]